jgi:hypothetical protein
MRWRIGDPLPKVFKGKDGVEKPANFKVWKRGNETEDQARSVIYADINAKKAAAAELTKKNAADNVNWAPVLTRTRADYERERIKKAAAEVSKGFKK